METLSQALGWAGSAPALVRFIGIAELAGAAGLLLPMLTRIKPRLTAHAGLGLATVMTLASIFHVFRGELQALPLTITLGAVAAFVAWGRATA
jgi:hypothetical protein